MNKKTSLKKHLFASASALAIGAFAHGAYAADVDRADGGSTAATAGQTVDFAGTEDVLTGIVTVADGITIGAVTANAGDGAGNGSGAGHGTGTLTFSGSGGGTTIGTTTDRLGLLNAGATGATVSISGASFVNSTSITGTGTLSLGGLLTGATVDFAADGTVSVASGVGLSAAVTSSLASTTTGRGTLTLVGGSQTVSGAVGTSTNYIKIVNAGATGGTSTFSGAVFAATENVTGTGNVVHATNSTINSLSFDAAGTVKINNGVNITSSTGATNDTGTAAQGTIDFLQGGTFTGDIGTSSSTGNLGTLKIDSGNNDSATVTTTGNIYAAAITFTGDSTLVVADGKTVKGAITASDGEGTVTFTGGGTSATTTMTGDIGVASTGDLKLVTIGNTATHTLSTSGNISATTINFATDSTLSVASSKTLTGNITATTAGQGTLTLAGSNTVTGNVGATGSRQLKLINLGGTGTNAFSGTVDATDILFTADGTMTIADDQTLQVDAQATSVETSTTGTGTISFLGTSIVGGGAADADLGTSSVLLKAVNILAGSGTSATDTVTSNGSIYATSVVLGDHADDVVTLSIGAGETLQAAVTTFANGDGTLTFAGAGTMTGQIGTSTAELLKVNVGAGAVSFDSNTYATQLNFTGDNTLTVAAGKSFTSSNTSTAAITAGGGDNTGTLTFSGATTLANIVGTSAAELKAINFSAGSSTVSKSINAVTTTVATGATLTFTGAASHATNLVTAGSGTIALGSVATTLTAGTTAAGDVTFGSASSTLGVTITGGDNNDSGSLTAAGTVNLADGIVNVSVSSSEYIAAGKTYAIVTAGTLTAGGVDGITITDDSYALGFTKSTSATVLTLTSTRENTFQSASTLTNVQNVGSALETIGTGGDSALDTIQGSLNGLSSASAVESAVATLAPTNVASGATTQAVTATTDAAIGTVESHLEVARNETSGVATGSRANNSGVWGEVFGTAVDQSERKGVQGYQANIGGFSLGADTLVNNQTRIGAAFAYGNVDAEGSTVGTNGTGNTNVDSYQGSLYGTYDLGKVYYEGLASFAYNKYDTDRTDFLGTQHDANFDGQQYSAKATAGYKMDVQGGLKVTPFVSAQYSFLTQDDYTESGTGSALTVKTDDINIFKTGLGAKLAYPITDGGVTYTPRLSGAWYYDLVGDEVSTTSNFVSSTTSFTTKGASVAQSEFKLGAGLDILSQDNVTVSLDYNWDTKENYDAHTGEVKARFEF